MWCGGVIGRWVALVWWWCEEEVGEVGWWCELVGWLGRGSTTLHCTHYALPHHLRHQSFFSFANFLLCVMFSRVFCVLPLLAFGQDVQLSMAAVRPLDLPARSPTGRASP